MLQSKVWFPLAIVGATTGGLFWNPTAAQALTFTLGGALTASTPNTNNFTYNLPFAVGTSVGGRPATVTSATITGVGGQGVIRTGAGGSLNGAVLKLGNFNIMAGSLGTIDPNPSLNAFNTFLTFSNTFFVPIANSANVRVGQILSGSFPNNFTGTTNQVIFPGASISLGSGSINPPNLAVGALTNSRAFFQIPSSSSFTNGAQVSQFTINAQLSDLVLAPGQTLNLPASACVVVAEETEHFKLTEDDIATACGEDGEGGSVTVPESSSVVGLLAMGAIAATTWMRRRITA